MAYDKKKLSVLSYANGFTLFHYRTSGESYELLETGYFNPAAKMMRPGDFILINAVNRSAIFVVERIDDGLVEVREMAW